MKKIYSIFILIVLVSIVAACGKDDDHQVITEPLELEQLSVALTVTNEVAVGETVHMSALVTMGERKIEEADEVVYEIWEEGKKSESMMIDAINEGDGIYTAETSFSQDGLFHIQVHVTAEAQHTMPIEQVTVGDGGEYDEVADSQYETEGFSMHFMNIANVREGDEKNLTVHIELHDEALEDLKVRYEISHEDNTEQHDWVDATEENAGEYSGSYIFKETGTYTIVIHVEDDDSLHEHEEYTILVN